MIVDWNGQLVPESAAAIGLVGPPTALADGLYETLRCYAGIPFDLESHVRRLQNGCKALRIDAEVEQLPWRSRIDGLLAANELVGQDARIRIVLHRSSNLKSSSSVNVAIMAWSVATKALQDRQMRGMSLITATNPRPLEAGLYQVKSLNLLATSIAQQEARQASADDALFANTRGEICETTYANLFAVIGQKHLKTPPISSPCLPGVTRMHILQLARHEGWKVEEAPIQMEELQNAQEIFLTSSVSEIMPVVQLNGRVVAEGRPGTITELLQQKYSDLVKETLAKTTA